MQKQRYISSVFFIGMLAATISNTGTLLVVNKSSKSVTFFDEKNLKLKAHLSVGDEPHEVAISPSGNFAVVSNYGSSCRPGSSITVLDIGQAKVLKNITLPDRSRPHGVKFISENNILVTAEGIQSLLLVDIESTKVIKTLPLPGEGAHLLTVDNNKQYAYISNIHSGSATKVDLQAFLVLQETKIGNAAEGIILTPDENHLLVTNRKDHIVAVLRTSDLTWESNIKTDKGPIRLALFDDGKQVVLTNCESGTVQTIDLATLTLLNTFASTKSFSVAKGKILGGFFGLLPVPLGILVRDDQQTAFVANAFAGNITLINLLTGDIIKSFEALIEPDGLGLSAVNF